MFKILIIVGALSLGASARAGETCALLLAPENLETLRGLAAPESAWRVSVLRGTIKDRPRVVVLLGERRGTGAMAADARQKLTRHFDAFGVEHADYSRTWGGRSLKLSLRAVEMMWPIGRFGRVNPTLAAAADAVFKIDLERGHRPSWSENIGSIALPILIAWQLYGFGLSLTDIGATADGGPLTALTTALYFVGGFAVTERMRRAFAKYDVTPKLIARALHVTFGQARTRTMAKNLIDSFSLDDTQTNALVMTSDHHRRSLEKHLVEVDHFERVVLD